MERFPNIVVFLSDDHGHWGMHCAGHRDLLTPNMDHLAAAGVRMTHAFTPSPVCSPARASFFTGLLPSRHGIHDWLTEDQGEDAHRGLGGQAPLALALQARGYQTALIGKWHCGPSRQPVAGFDRWFSYWDAQYPHYGLQRFSDQGRRVERHGHQAPMLAEQAIEFLRRRDPDRPFFLFVGLVNTHTPFAEQPQRLAAHYRHCDLADLPDEAYDPVHGVGVALWPRGTEEAREFAAQHHAAITMIDEQVGRVLDELDGLGETRNTLFVYTADHGQMNGHHGLFAKGNATTPQNFLEESIRVPCVLRWPDRLRPGQICDAMVDHCDLYQTLLEAAGVESGEEAEESPGRSYLGLLTGEDADSWGEAQFCEYGNARMIRDRRYKLIRRYPGPNGHFGDELYDLETDPREQENRIDDPALQTVVGAMSEKLDAHFTRHEEEERNGKRIGELPRHNDDEPWRRPDTPGSGFTHRRQSG